MDPRPFCGSHPPRVGPQSLQGVVVDFPTCIHPGPDSRLVRHFPPHHLEARSTSLLGMGISRWGTCRDCRLLQQPLQPKVYRMKTYRKLGAGV